MAAELPVTGTAAVAEELLVLGVAVDVAELLELEELLVVGVGELLLELEELLVVGVAVGAAAPALELEELLELEVPPVTGTPAPAVLLPLLTLALKPMPISFCRRPCITLSHLAKSPDVPWPLTTASACLRAKAY